MCAATAEIGSLGMTIGVLVAAIPNGDCGIACRQDRAGVDTTILRLGLWNLFILKTQRMRSGTGISQNPTIE
jgi:hypothetical protein